MFHGYNFVTNQMYCLFQGELNEDICFSSRKLGGPFVTVVLVL